MRWLRISALLAVLALVSTASLLGAATAAAKLAPVAIDQRTAKFEKEGSGWVVKVGFTNLTDEPIALDAPPVGAGARCDPTLDHEAKLPPQEHREFKVALPAGCEIGDKKAFEFTVEASVPDTAAPIAFTVTTEAAKPKAATEWDALYWFLYALGALALIAVLYLAYRWLKKDQAPWAPLKGLGSAYSFKESWVSNVTVGAGLLTGVLGSSGVVDALLGEDSKDAIALATVGAAIAVAMIAAAPLVLEATRVEDQQTEPSSEGEVPKDYYSLGGMVLASIIPLAAAFGELWVVFRTGKALDLGGIESNLWIFFGLGALLLLVYAWRVLPRTVAKGLIDPPDPKPSDTILAAQMLIEQMKASFKVTVGDTEAAEVESLVSARMDELVDQLPPSEPSPPEAPAALP
jgi:hypothetical protein